MIFNLSMPVLKPKGPTASLTAQSGISYTNGLNGLEADVISLFSAAISNNSDIANGSVKSYAQICFGIWQKSITGGRLNRPLVTLQQAGHKGSRAAVRRSSCP